MYPLDRRKLAMHVYSLFNSLRKAAKIMKVSHTTVSRWLKNPDKKKYTRKTVPKSVLIIETLRASITNDPFISILSMKQIIKDTFNFEVSKELIRTAIKSMNFSRKKARFFSTTKDLHIKTTNFIQERDRLLSQGCIFFSLDETSFGRHGKPVNGYSPKGKVLRIVRKQPRITTVSSLVMISEKKIVQRINNTKSFNSTLFFDFIKSYDFPEKSVILLDNVKFHHCKIVKQYCNEKNISLLYVPPYSPWFNPIEGVFSIVKRLYYKSGDIECLFSQVTPGHIEAFFKDSLKKIDFNK
jgi:transposase